MWVIVHLVIFLQMDMRSSIIARLCERAIGLFIADQICGIFLFTKKVVWALPTNLGEEKIWASLRSSRVPLTHE